MASEMPLLHFTFGNGLTQSLQKMSSSGRKKLMSLHDRQAEGGREKTVLGIVVTNCLAGQDGKTTLVYHTISRFNHSCLPNVRVDQRFPTNVIAVTDIVRGSEVCWCYDIESCMSQCRLERRTDLQQGWGIPECRCVSCNKEGEELLNSDQNRLKVAEVEEALTKAIQANSQSVLHLVKAKEELLRTEGLDTADTLARLRRDLMHGEMESDLKEGFREEGLQFAELVKDDVLVNYFKDVDTRKGCKDCHRCKM